MKKNILFNLSIKKLTLVLKLILRAKFIFKTPKEYDLIIFDKESVYDLNNCLSKFNFFVLQTRLENIDEIYFSYKILKKIFKNYFKGNLFTVYLISLIELIRPRVVITNIDNSFKFSDVAKILEKKTNFIAIQNASRYDLLAYNYFYNTKKMKHNILEKFYIPNLFCFGDYERELYNKLNIKAKNIYPIGNLRWANFLHHIKSENHSHERYNSDICLISEYVDSSYLHASDIFDKHTKKKVNNPKLAENINLIKGFVGVVKYTIKFCIRNNMKLIIPLKRDKKLTAKLHEAEYEYYKKNLKKEEFDYVQKSFLEKDRDDFSSFRAVLNSKVAIGVSTTLLMDKLGIGGKILHCNFTKQNIFNFPINGICTLNNFSYEEFEKRLLEIYSISKENFLSKMDKKPGYVMKFNENNSTINLIREKLSQLGMN